MTETPSVGVVVLNWRGWQDTIRCLESLRQQTHQPYRVVVVDNDSQDESVPEILTWAGDGRRRAVPEQGRGSDERDVAEIWCPSDWLTVIRSTTNLGFARGNNLGVRHLLRMSDVRYVLLLNNDTVLHRTALEHLVDAVERRPEAGLAGPRILDMKDDSDWQFPVAKRLDFTGLLLLFTGLNRLVSRTRAYASYFYRGRSETALYAIPGSCMLFRREILERWGGLDEATFLYWEEFIVAEKLRAEGVATVFVPSSVVWHRVGASTAKLGVGKFLANMQSESYFVSTYLHLSRPQRLAVAALRVVAFAIRSLTQEDYRQSARAFVRTLRLYVRHEVPRETPPVARAHGTEVLLVTGTVPPDPCGVGDNVQLLASHLASSGCEVGILTSHNAKRPIGAAGVTVLPVVRSWRLSQLAHLRKAVARVSPGVLHVHYPTAGYGHGLLPQALVLVSSGVVVTIHEASQSHLLRRVSLYPLLLRAGRVIATTEHEAGYLRKLYPPVDHKLTVIPIVSAIEPAEARSRAADQVAYFGLIAPRKGLEEVIEFARLAQAQGLRLHVLVMGSVGSGQERYAAELRAAASGLPLRWLADLSAAEVAEHLATVGACYLPYPDGASGRRSTLMAALVSGTPVITTRGEATTSDLQDGRNVLFSDGPAAALAQSQRLGHDQALRERLMSGARAYAQTRSWPVVVQRHRQLYSAMGPDFGQASVLRDSAGPPSKVRRCSVSEPVSDAP